MNPSLTSQLATDRRASLLAEAQRQHLPPPPRSPLHLAPAVPPALAAAAVPA